MRYLILYSLALFTFAIACPNSGLAQTRKQRGNWERVSFWTADGVKIHGKFYPGPKGNKSATVILLHDLNQDSLLGSWTELAADLQLKEKTAVLLFSFRGHGESREVKEEFWEIPFNRYAIRGRLNVRMPPEEIDAENFQPGYHRSFVNDLAAARAFLDQRNDAQECNAQQLILVGEGEGATVGNIWLGLESRRYRIANSFAGIRDRMPETSDYAGAVWLNPCPNLGGKSIAMGDWLRVANASKPIHVGVIYDPTDNGSARCAKYCQSAYAGKRGSKNSFVVLKASTSERSEQLIESESMREKIRNYVFNRVTDDLPGWEQKRFEEQRYVWTSRLGVILAKLEGERNLRYIPADWVDRP